MQARLAALTIRLLSLLPLALSRWLGTRLGLLAWWAQSEAARITLQNIQLCFPGLSLAEQRQLARASLQQTLHMAMETPAVWHATNPGRANWVNRLIEPTLFEQALNSGQGLIVLIPHFGNWEMAGMLVSARRPCTILYREPRMTALNELLGKLRNVGTTHLVPANGKGVSAVLKTLKEGGMTVILPDQEPARQGGIFSPFFGVPAYTMTLVHRLQQKTGARILFAYALPEADGFSLGFQAADTAITSEEEQAAVDAMNRSIEQIVLLAPEHYQWEYKRFRKRPAGEPKLYR